MVCAPDIALNKTEPIAFQQAVLNHCEQTGDRFAILDSLQRDSLSDITDRPQDLRQGGLSGTNGALYYPWIRVPGGPTSTGGLVPPCGHVAGVYAATDQRVGVHKAPANQELASVLDLAVNLTDAQQGELDPNGGVNCLRAFPGRGIRIWGARTLSKDPAWTYINVRRLFLTVGRWIERTMAEVVFEPNDFMLWVRLERELAAYLSDLLRFGP